MDCPHCQEHFAAMLEGAPEEEVAAARRHLAACPGCAAAFADYQRTVAAVRELPLLPPPAAVLPGIYAALDTLAPRRRSLTPLWQPLTAGLSLAACLALVLWAVVLQPGTYLAPAGEGEGPRGRPSELGASRPAPVVEALGRVRTATAPSRPLRTPPSVATRRREGARLVLAPPLPAWPELGNWATTSESGAVPGARTLGEPTGSNPTAPPLHPTPGPVQLTFTPPAERTVGVPVVGELVIDSQGEYEATVRVSAQRGLRVANAREGVLYSGAVRKGELLRLPVKLLAHRAGTQRLRIALEANLPEARTELDIMIPGFVGEVSNPGAALVTLRFTETPLRQAARELAAAAGARVVIDDAVPEVRVTQDYSAGVPVGAALRVLAEAAGCRLEEREGVFHLVK